MSLSTAVCLAAVGSAAAAPPSAVDDWLQVETENFKLFGNAPRASIARVARSLERLREVLARLSPSMSVHSPIPTYVYVFDDERAFRPYRPSLGGRPGTMPGVFLGHRDANYLAIDAGGRRDPASLIYHEYLHAYTAANLPGAPLWFVEGIAEYYSSFRVYGERAEIGRPLAAHVRWIRENSLIPLERLFAIDRDSAEYHESRRRGVFYAESWLLVHYLHTAREDGTQALARFLARRDEDPAVVWREEFGETPAETLAELRRYARRSRFRYAEHRFESLGEEREPAVEPMPAAEVYFRLGDLLAHNEPVRASAAATHFHTALAHDPEHAGAHRGLGYLLDLRGDRKRADTYYARAQQLDPGDPLPFLLQADSLVDRFYGADGVRVAVRGAETPELLRARTLYGKVRTLSPHRAEAHAGFAKTFVFEEGDVAEGLDAVHEARRLLPERADVAYDHVLLHLIEGEREDAVEALGALERFDDPQLVGSARDTLVQFDLERLNELTNAGRDDEALALLLDVRRRLVNPELRARVELQLERLERELRGRLGEPR